MNKLSIDPTAVTDLPQNYDLRVFFEQVEVKNRQNAMNFY